MHCKYVVMCMYNPTKGFWKNLCVSFVFILMLGVNAKVMSAKPDTQAVQWRDTLYVRIADSLFLEAEKALVFSLEIYRPNDDWNKDKILGDFDFYFSYSEKAFNASSSTPAFESLMEKMDESTNGRKNLLFGYTHFYAGRYGICGRADNSSGDKYEIPLQTWVELCRVKIPMSRADQNPGIRWDVKATGAMTAGGNPIILKLAGDVENNPKATVKAVGLKVMPELQCQGEDVYLYVREAITSGKGLTFTWRDSVAGEKWNTLGEFEATTAIKNGSSKDGRYQFEVLGVGDTLVIKNSHGIVEGMYFNCTLSDASVGASITVDTVVNVRDSLYGYLASTEPSSSFGMSSQIDTVKKCPDLPADIRLYVFGPTMKSMQTDTKFGSKIMMYYCYLDEDLNTLRDSVEISRTKLFQGYKKNTNKLNKDLFEYKWQTEHTGKLWIESIQTAYCNNGAGYSAFDTLVIQEMEGDLSYNMVPLTVSVKETIDLDTPMITKKPYEIFLKNDPSLIGGVVMGSPEPGEIYTYYAGEKAGYDTVYYQYEVGKCTMKAYRSIEVVENSYLTMKVLLEGPYLGVNDEMQDTLRAEYARQEKLGYKIFPRNNVGRIYSPHKDNLLLDTKVKNITDIKTSSSICDWIYIELQEVVVKETGETGGQILDSVSAFVLQNGEVCDVNGETLKFKNKGNTKVFVRIKHRNHMIVVSNPVVLPVKEPVANTYVVDFTDYNSVYGGTNVVKLVNGKYCLLGGDLNDDGFITVQDRNIVVKQIGDILYENDVNQDTFITVQDRNFVTKNMGAYYRLP